MSRIPTAAEIFGGLAKSTREFRVISDGHYELVYPEYGVSFDANRLRRRFDALVGELTVVCNIPGSNTDDDGVLSMADFDFSNATARETRAKLLAKGSKTENSLWELMLEHFSRRVLHAERQGEPGVSLRDVAPAATDSVLTIDGLSLPRAHPAILFGDGSAGKSYFALYLAGRLVQQGLRVVYFDWELDAPDHRDRLASLFGAASMPDVKYARCWKPAFQDIDRLKREAERWRAEYAIFDSIVPACDGNPIDSEVVTRYMAVGRQLKIGALHLAHITKGGSEKTGDNTQKPFGSVFWHNLARSTWYMERAIDSGDDEPLRVGMYQRKSNLGRLSKSIGFEFEFQDGRTRISRFDLTDVAALSQRLSTYERMRLRLRSGPLTLADLAEELDAKAETVERTARRYDGTTFTRLTNTPDGITRIALVERRTA